MEPLEDTFVGASLKAKDESSGFGAEQYSFFGELGGGDGELSGALEDGLDAPPEEEGLDDEGIDLEDDDEEDYSYASMFASLASPTAKATLAAEDLDVAALTTPPGGFGSRDREEEQPPMPSPSLFGVSSSSSWPTGSIGLGSLLTSTPPQAFDEGRPDLSSLIAASLPPAPVQQQQAPAQAAPSSSAMTAQELEAMLLGQSPSGPSPQQQQQQQQYMQQQQRQQPPMPGYPPMPQMGGPPPPGGPMPFPPHPAMMQGPPPMGPPGGPMMRPPMGPPPPGMGAWARPPPQHFQQQGFPPRGPPQQMPMGGGGPRGPPHQHPHHQAHANLAQRLRALNLAERHEGERRMPARRRGSSQYMDAEEIEHILFMQWRPLHQGPPYLEDYYYQAFVNKYYNKKNRRFFAPESVRELAPTEKMASDDVAFVKLEGLGKMPFSNIRRPRPLMDVTPEELNAAKANKDANADSKVDEKTAARKPLENEPLVAARIMIEDCMALLLDVLDIDCIFAAAPAGAIDNQAALLQRRSLLIDGLAASLRLSEGAEAKPGADGVFLRLLTLPKGRNLAARALKAVAPPPEVRAAAEQLGERSETNLRLLWAVLRNAKALFGPKQLPAGTTAHVKGAASLSPADEVAVTAKIPAAAAELCRHLPDASAVGEAVTALIRGDLASANDDPLKLPLFAPGSDAQDIRYPWLSDILVGLMQRAAELKMVPGSDAALPPGWADRLKTLKQMVVHHVEALKKEAEEAEDDAEALKNIKQHTPSALLKVLQAFVADDKERKELQQLVGTLA